MRKRIKRMPCVLLALLTVCFATAGAASATTIEWAGNGYSLESGQNGFLNHKVFLYASEVIGTSAMLGCAGIREVEPLNCEKEEGELAGVVKAVEYFSEPYLHNHGSKRGTFRGFYSHE